MDRRNFFRSLIGGVAAAAAVRTWPFRVFSFPTDLRILNPIVGQTVYTTASGSNNYFALNEAAIQAIELETVAEQIPDLIMSETMLYKYMKGRRTIEVSRGRFTVTGIANSIITVKPA